MPNRATIPALTSAIFGADCKSERLKASLASPAGSALARPTPGPASFSLAASTPAGAQPSKTSAKYPAEFGRIKTSFAANVSKAAP